MSETRTVRLGDIAEVNPKGDKLSSDTNVSFVGMSDLNASKAEGCEGSQRLFSEVSKGYTQFRRGDILVAKITPCWENGKIGIANISQSHGAGSTEFHVVRPHESIDTRYLLHKLREPNVSALGAIRMTGSAGQRRVPASFISNLNIELPSLEEQKKYALIKDLQMEITEKRERQQDLFDELERARFIEKYGNPITNPKNLPMVRLSDIATITTGNSPSRSNKENFGHYIEWIKSNNLGSKYATKASEYLSEVGAKKARIAPSGSILVTCIAGSPSSIGKCSIVDRDVAFNQQINSITPFNPEDLEFIWNQINLFPEIIQNKSTGGMKGIVSRSKFSNINILTRDRR
ncbi:restriction endonuclease subunit S [Rothia nasimurium]|uniref:restriction endonuclease subunit S n=1 Tax=Rothia nasimurium TaxID=85336 RepID=UPI001F01A47F|nr:restriction endonuclease subunit S [Rothia nasimurium]